MFRHIDTKRPDGCYIQFERVIKDDPLANPGDYLFQDPDYLAQDRARLRAYEIGRWHYIGVAARANILFVENGVGTLTSIESAGVWGIESDSGEDYLGEVFAEECEALKRMLASLHCYIEENGEALPTV